MIEEITDCAECFGEIVEGSCGRGAQMCLEFRKRHFNWVKVWRIGGQKEEPRASLPEIFGGLRAFVNRQIVEDDERRRGGQSGWFGDPEGHSEASRRGWAHRR